MTHKEANIYLCEPVEEGAYTDNDGYDEGWYFSDEADDLVGPYSTLEIVREALADYVKNLDAGAYNGS